MGFVELFVSVVAPLVPLNRYKPVGGVLFLPKIPNGNILFSYIVNGAVGGVKSSNVSKPDFICNSSIIA